MSSFTSDQGPISSISESATGESYLFHAMASTLFCENYLYLGMLVRLRCEACAREHRFLQCLPPPSWRAAWLILDCAHRTSTFFSCAICEPKGDQAALSLSHL